MTGQSWGREMGIWVSGLRVREGIRGSELEMEEKAVRASQKGVYGAERRNQENELGVGNG